VSTALAALADLTKMCLERFRTHNNQTIAHLPLSERAPLRLLAEY